MTAKEDSANSSKANVVSTAPSAVSTTAKSNNGTPYQTRFAFYHAEELTSSLEKQDEEEEEDTKRLEKDTEAKVEADKEADTDKEVEKASEEVEDNDNGVDVNEILENLKETEVSINNTKRKFSGYSSFDSEKIVYTYSNDGDNNNATDSKQQQQQSMNSESPTDAVAESDVPHGVDLPSTSVTHSQPTADPGPSESSDNDVKNEFLPSSGDSSQTTPIPQAAKIANNLNKTKKPSTNITSSSAMETIVWNALHHIRARAQRRAESISPPDFVKTPSSSPPSSQNGYNDQILLKTPTSTNSSKKLQQNQNELITHNTNNNNSSGLETNDSATVLEESLSKHQMERKARRARMADYAARQKSTTVNEIDQPKTPPSNKTNASKTSSHIPLPLHPSSTISTNINNDNQSLIPATKYDNRLLSPAIDVRKTVEGSDVKVFRPNNTPAEVNGPNIDLANPILSYASGRSNSDSSISEEINNLRALPFLGQPEPQSKESPSSDSNHFSLTPSSPAPGSVISEHSAIESASNDTSTEIAGGHSYAQTHNTVQTTVDTKFSTKWNAEEEIEMGVESVLVAILEHAGKKAGEAKNNPQNQTDEEYDDDGGDIIEKAFASLFIQRRSISSSESQPTSNTSSAFRRLRPLKREKKTEQELTRSQTSSVVEELLAEDDEECDTIEPANLHSEEVDVINTNNLEPINQNSAFPTSTLITNKDVDAFDADDYADNDSNSIDGKPFVAIKQEHKPPRLTCSRDEDEILGVEAIHELEKSVFGNASLDSPDSRDNEREMNRKVLGPLSKKMGGTTGVVLEDVDEDEIVDGRVTPNDPVSNVIEGIDNIEGSTSPSIINSLTSAVRNAPKILSVFSSDNSQSSPRMPTPKDATGDQEIYEYGNDYEANAMMKELCSHLLPYGVDKSTHNSNKFSGWFMGIQKSWSTERRSNPGLLWNDDDPDELGFEVRKLTKSQLRRVENEFENMVNNLRQNSERDLLKGNESPQTTKNGLKLGTSKQTLADSQQDDFERGLAEAENILDLEEREHQAKVKSTPAQIKESEDECDIETKSHDGSEDMSASADSEESDVSNPLSKNPFFPNAKAAGHGKVGELEIYHLPIIYKAKQTGFEPTKDLILQPGTIFAGQYFVQNELGSAAFSTAYRCVDLTSGKRAEDGEEYYDEVCLKVIKNTKDFFDQSLDEIKILELIRKTGQCEEHNLIEMKAFFYHKEHLVIVTELLRQNLFEFGKYIIENEEPTYFTIPRLCYIVRQCLIALNFIHSLGLVHSDIKPENILLASYSRAKVKVIDFGSSCYLIDRQSSYIQSRSYRAPEVILGLPYDGKIDIWSLGCVIAEMYTGQVTFQNDSVVSMLSRIEAICGPFPRHMIANGRQSGQYFTQSGLLYEVVEPDEISDHKKMSSISFDLDVDKSDDETMYKIYQPKRTTISARLGFDVDLIEQRRSTWADDEKAMFADFVKRLLTIDPDSRPSASEALEHPWILSGHSMSEDSIKYPPED